MRTATGSNRSAVPGFFQEIKTKLAEIEWMEKSKEKNTWNCLEIYRCHFTTLVLQNDVCRRKLPTHNKKSFLGCIEIAIYIIP
jgi:hypothetical protein